MHTNGNILISLVLTAATFKCQWAANRNARAESFSTHLNLNPVSGWKQPHESDTWYIWPRHPSFSLRCELELMLGTLKLWRWTQFPSGYTPYHINLFETAKDAWRLSHICIHIMVIWFLYLSVYVCLQSRVRLFLNDLYFSNSAYFLFLNNKLNRVLRPWCLCESHVFSESIDRFY